MRLNKFYSQITEDGLNVLVKEKSFNYGGNWFSCNSPDKIHKLMVDVFELDKMAEEYVYLIAMNNKCRPIGIFEISHGTANASYCSPQTIFTKALLCGAVHIVVVHNHPSTITEPSSEDRITAKCLKDAGNLLKVQLMDFIIIGGNSYYSFKEENVL